MALQTKLDTLPHGWKWIKNTTTAPREYRWAYNGESLFSGKRVQTLVKEQQGRYK